MEADAVRPGTVSLAPVMGRDTPEPLVTHVRMVVWVYLFNGICVQLSICVFGLLLVVYFDTCHAF